MTKYKNRLLNFRGKN